MNEYIFYTCAGYTEPPLEGKEVENCQVLGRATGNTPKEAKELLIKNNPWIEECGFDLYDTICKQIVTDELIVEIENNRKQIEFLIDLLDKRQLEEFVNWLSMR